MCQAEKGSQTECQWEQQREEEHVRERQKKKKGCAKWQKGREGSEQNAEGGKGPVTVTGGIFLSIKGSKWKKKILNPHCLEFSEHMPSFLW